MVSMFQLGETPADPMDLLTEEIQIPRIHLYNGDDGSMVPWVSKGTSLGRVLVPTDRIPNQPDVPTPDYSGFIKADIPIMPQHILNVATAFFRFVLDTNHTEAALLLALDEENNYHLYCPEQEVDYTGVEWKDNIELEEGHYLMGSIHSHCNFSAFHSGTDEGDAAKNDGLHITLGKLDENVPEIDVMLSFSGVKWQKWDLKDFLEGEEWKPLTADDQDQAELFDIEWLGQLTDAPTWRKYLHKGGTSPAGKVVGYGTQKGYGHYSGYGWDDDDDWELGEYWEGYGGKGHGNWEKSTDPREVPNNDISMYKRINRESNWYDEQQDIAQDQIIKDMCDLVLLASEVGMTINFSVQHREGAHEEETGDMTPLLPERSPAAEGESEHAVD